MTTILRLILSIYFFNLVGCEHHVFLIRLLHSIFSNTSTWIETRHFCTIMDLDKLKLVKMVWIFGTSQFFPMPSCLWKYFSLQKSLKNNCLHLGPISSTCLRAAFKCADPKRLMKLTVFLHFWDLHAQKLYVKCWWHWHLFTIFNLNPSTLS